MATLGEALLLLHRAPESFDSVRARIRTHIDRRLAVRAQERFAASPEGRAAGFDEDFVDRRGEAEPAVEREELRVWFAPPDRIRVERESVERGDAAPTSVAVRDGQNWWRYYPGEGVHSNEGDPSLDTDVGGDALWLFDPSLLLVALRFSLECETEAAGRPALRLSATLRPGGHSVYALGSLAPGADGYELLLDRERGVLLRAASLLEGEELALTDIVELGFDEDFPPETFVLSLPARTKVESAWSTTPEKVTLAEAARRASFPVWVPREMPAGWKTTVGYIAEDASGESERVLIRVWRPDATHSISIVESRAAVVELEEDDWHEWARDQREGFSFEIAEDEGGMTWIRFVREGTAIQVIGDLGADAVIGFARDLRLA